MISQCIYNDYWLDAPCFDTGPVSHLEFYKGWAPYYEHKGSEWMEIKKIELHESIEKNNVEEWADNSIENYNVYRYYLSTNEIKSHLPYDSFFVVLDPFFTPESNFLGNNDDNIIPSVGYSYDGIVFSIILTCVGVSFIIVMIYWWKRK